MVPHVLSWLPQGRERSKGTLRVLKNRPLSRLFTSCHMEWQFHRENSEGLSQEITVFQFMCKDEMQWRLLYQDERNLRAVQRRPRPPPVLHLLTARRKYAATETPFAFLSGSEQTNVGHLVRDRNKTKPTQSWTSQVRSRTK